MWSRNGTELVDGAGVSGSHTATLSLTNAHAEQAGSYRVQVSNSAGTVSSNDAVLTVTPPPPPPDTLTAALDDPGLQWSTGGDGNWAPQTQTTHDGVDAARSGTIADSQSSTLDTTVTGPATVSFWWKVDSEKNFDFLNVDVDGQRGRLHLRQRGLAAADHSPGDRRSSHDPLDLHQGRLASRLGRTRPGSTRSPSARRPLRSRWPPPPTPRAW